MVATTRTGGPPRAAHSSIWQVRAHGKQRGSADERTHHVWHQRWEAGRAAAIVQQAAQCRSGNHADAPHTRD